MTKKHANYNKNIFINCPFDTQYYELLRVLLFTIVYFDFSPRIALESSDSGSARLEKILRLIRESRYAIHDISRLQAKAIDEYYRLNMPFELGLDYGLREFNKDYADKRSLILETDRFEYMKAISDINGLDIKNHEDVPEKLIESVRSWFSETVGLRNLNSSEKIYTDFIDFNKQLFMDRLKKYKRVHNYSNSEKFASSEIEEMTIPEFIDEIRNWISSRS